MPSKKTNLTVKPIDGIAPWVGGKRNLARRLVARIEAVDHHTYAEPFVGMGGVFLRRVRRARNEVINDRSGEIVNLFRVLQRHPDAFIDQLRWRVFSRSEFDRLCCLDPVALTDVERAARFYWMQRCCFGGLPTSRSFPATPIRGKGIAPEVIRKHVAALHARLAKVTIENLPYEEFMRRYDRARTLFYLDPPYWGCENHYGKGLFERADFVRIADQLARLRGRFILSLNNVPEVRRIFRQFRIDRAPMVYKLRGTKNVTELIISGGR